VDFYEKMLIAERETAMLFMAKQQRMLCRRLFEA